MVSGIYLFFRSGVSLMFVHQRSYTFIHVCLCVISPGCTCFRGLR